MATVLPDRFAKTNIPSDADGTSFDKSSPYRKYLRSFFLSALIPLGLLTLFNLLVDPYGAFGFLSGTTFSHSASALGSRIGKAEALSRHDWDLLLLGNSRVEIGLDPQNPALANLRQFTTAGSTAPILQRSMAPLAWQ